MNNRSQLRFLLAATYGAALAVTAPSTVAHAQQEAEEDGEQADVSEDAEAETVTEDSPAPPAKAEENLQSLRDEYLKLRDKIFRSKARANAVASALYSTRMEVHLGYDTARYYTVTRSIIRLDGATVYTDGDGAIASSKGPRFEGFVAPGRHQLTFRIEATGKDDARFKSVIENQFVVIASKGKDLIVKANAEDHGDIAYKWQKKASGSYKLHLDVSVKSQKSGTAKEGEGHIQRSSRKESHGRKPLQKG